jgi:Na+/melibiose symporter-like transporter
MEPVDFSKSEYEALYREIQDHGTRLYQVLSFCVAGSTALLSYVFTIDSGKLPYREALLPFLLLLPFLILVPSLLLVLSCLHNTTRIASYLQYRYERENSGIVWQTSIQKYRKRYDRNWRQRPFRWALIAVFGSLGLTSMTASAVSFYFNWNQHHFSSLGKQHWFAGTYGLLILLFVCFTSAGLVSLWNKWGCGPFAAEEKLWEDLDTSAKSPLKSSRWTGMLMWIKK